MFYASYLCSMKQYPLVVIEWEDSQLGFQGWKFINEQEFKVPTLFSVGFLVHEDDKCKVLYPHIKPMADEEDISGSGDILIPNSAIKKVTQIEFSISSFLFLFALTLTLQPTLLFCS